MLIYYDMFSCRMPSEDIDETSNQHCVVDVNRFIVLLERRQEIDSVAWYNQFFLRYLVENV